MRILEPAVPANIMEDQVTRQLEEQLAITEDSSGVTSTTLEGTTDDLGESDMNVDSSARRARRVRDFLVNQGVALHRVNAKGFGPTAPIVSNKKRNGRAKNRRVEFTITERISPEAAQ